MSKPKLNPVSNVLNKVLANLGLDKRLREHTFLSLWPTFVSGAIAERSRPLFIDSDRNLVIAVADAATGQELSMLKSKILSKVAPAARSLSIEIRGLRMDMKHYHSASTMPPPPKEVKPLPKPSESDLSNVVLTDEDRAQIDALRLQFQLDEAVDPALKEKIPALFERELRIRRFQLAHAFPVCPACGNPSERLHPPESAGVPTSFTIAVCMTCLYAPQP